MNGINHNFSSPNIAELQVGREGKSEGGWRGRHVCYDCLACRTAGAHALEL